MIFHHLVNQWDLSNPKMFGMLQGTDFVLNPEWVAEDRLRSGEFSAMPDFVAEINEKMKIRLRQGIPHSQRRKWWLIATGGIKMLSEIGDVWSSVFRKAQRSEKSEQSSFGGAVNISSFMPESFSAHIVEFLHVIWSQNRHIEFSPLIPTVSCLLLLYLEPQLAYLSLQSMINRSIDDSWYFTLSKEQFLASVQGFRDLAEAKCPNIVTHAEKLGLNVSQIGLALFPVFFLPFTPIQVALTVFDSFVSEGRKVLVRFCLSLFIQEQKQLLQTKTPKAFLMVLVSAMDKLSEIQSMKTFISNSFKIFLSRGKHIKKYESHAALHKLGFLGSPLHLSAKNINDMFDDSQVKEIMICGEQSEPLSSSFSEVGVFFSNNFQTSISQKVMLKASPEELEEQQKQMQQEFVHSVIPKVYGGELLTASLFYSIRGSIPSSYRHYSAYCCYQLSEHGISFQSLYQNCRRNHPYVLVIKTSNGVFGAFLTDGIFINDDTSHTFLGKPSDFVFSENGKTVYHKKPPPNQMFMLMKRTCIHIGGPRPAFAIEKDFTHLISEHCETFGSPSFMGSHVGDRILNVEAYSLASGESRLIRRHSEI